jgi:hypothetical protein
LVDHCCTEARETFTGLQLRESCFSRTGGHPAHIFVGRIAELRNCKVAELAELAIELCCCRPTVTSRIGEICCLRFGVGDCSYEDENA